MSPDVPDSNVYRLLADPDGTLHRFDIKERRPFHLRHAESRDNGHTWSRADVRTVIIFPADRPIVNLVSSALITTSSRSLLYFAYARTELESLGLDGRLYVSGPLPESVCTVVRSTDGGATWSDPIDIDGRGPEPFCQQRAKDSLSEVSAAETRDGRIVALVGPVQSPYMWGTWSEDDGMTWSPLARDPFPMYASTNSMIVTRSGTLLIGGHFPGLCVQASYDGALHGADTGSILASGPMERFRSRAGCRPLHLRRLDYADAADVPDHQR